MSEIDWRKLAAEHDRAPHEDTPDWLAALADFDEADAEERELALEADPLLLFRDLPEVEAGPADVEAMKEAVAAMRRTSASLRRAEGAELDHEPPQSVMRRWSIAALLALGVSAGALTGSLSTLPGSAVPGPTPTVEIAELSTWDRVETPIAVPPEIAQLPLVEDADPDAGPWMQIEDEGVSLVVVMTPTAETPDAG